MKEPIVYTGPAFVPWYEIKATLDRTTVRDAVEQRAKETNSLLFYLVGCAMYKITGDTNWHHTGRIFRVGRLDWSVTDADGQELPRVPSPSDVPNDRDIIRTSFYLKLGENLESNRLTLTREDIGGYAD